MWKRCACLLSLVFLAVAVVAAERESSAGRYDWPQWRGQKRDGTSAETGLLKDWPDKGPRLVWTAKGLGDGYSSVSVAAGHIYTMGDRKDRQSTRSEVEGYVICLDERTGKELWATRVSKRYSDGGPRSTPTVDGDRVYALSPLGDLVCLDAATGREHWHKSLPDDFRGQVGGWHYSESPLIDGDKLVCTPGGKEATLVALDKKTGDTIWKAKVPQGDAAAYSSIIVADVDGQREYIQFLGRGLVGVAATDGEFLWRYDRPANGVANCSTPVYDHDRVFAASAYSTGGGLARLTRNGNAIKAEQVYFTKDMQNHHGGMVLVNGYLYGSNEGHLCCLDFATGKTKWQNARPGKGSIAYADGRLYYRAENGPVTLVEANPHEYKEHGRFDTPEHGNGNAWPHPVIANGKLYLRHADLLFCYDVKRR
jgi:outer membrane protein assembly factor BamB